MASQLNDLDTDSLLLMYLAGELSNGVKSSLERRLASEPELAAELERVREANAFCIDLLQKDDELNRLPTSEAVAIRRVSRAMQQWHVHRVASVEPRKRGLLLPWWCYPTAAAAAIIIGFLVWSFRQQTNSLPAVDGGGVDGGAAVALEDQKDGASPDQSSEEIQSVASQSQTELADWMDSSFGVSAEASADQPQPGQSSTPAMSGSDDSASILPTPLPEESVQ
jgi:anti-sigma factor RsiW